MRRRDFYSCAAASLLAFCWPAAANAADTSLADQLLKQSRIADVSFSPSGAQLAFVVSEPPVGKERRSNVWLYDAKTGSSRRLTFAAKQDQHPRWSPDGSALAFISSRNGHPQAFLLSLAGGGEAEELATGDVDVTDIQWSPKGDAIAFTGKKTPPKHAETGRDQKVQSEVMQPQRLGVIRLADRKIQWLLPADRWSVRMFAWMPDGAHVLATATQDKRPEKVVNQLYEIALDGQVREVGVLPGVELDKLRVSPDGQFAAFIGSSNGPVAHDVFVQPVAGGPARDLTGASSQASLDRPAGDLEWKDARTLSFSTHDGLGGAIYTLSVNGGRANQVRDFKDAEISELTVKGSQFAYVKTTSVTAPEINVLSGAREQQITHIQPDFANLLKPRVIKYRGADGFEIEAQLYTPPQSSGRTPLVVLVHGGPSSRWSASISNWAQMLVAKGITVLAPNIRGSEGYGTPFLQANRGDWGGGDFRDIQAGVDVLVSQGLADENRVGIGGWSYGGYMSAWATTQTPRFKAAVVGAAVLDLTTEWGTEEAEILPYDIWYLGTPWERPQDFDRMSPLTHANKVTTPTLILVGEDDPVDPIAQDWQFYRTLRLSNVKTEMVVYPREEHHIEEEEHARDVLNRMTSWMVDHLANIDTPSSSSK